MDSFSICRLHLQAPHIDKTDFLNAVVREKKRFENVLDDSVAAGMNAGTEVLMNQVIIIFTSTVCFDSLDRPCACAATISAT